MKSFDLTFSGIVLPERDPAQVKRDFALFFGIQELTVIDEIFSGKTIVLRQNLDRKTAAEYFSKITQIGGQATLAATDETRTKNKDTRFKLTLESTGATRITRGRDSTAAERASHPLPSPAIADVLPTIEHDSKLSRILETGKTELNRLRDLMAQMREDSRQGYARLAHEKEQLQRAADEELARIDKLSNDCHRNMQSELAALQANEDRAREAGSVEIATAKQQGYDQQEHAHLEEKRITTLQEKLKEAEIVVVTENAARQETARIQAANEVDRLQKLIQDVRQQANLKIAEAAQQLEALRLDIQSQAAALQQQKVELQAKLERDTAALQQRQQDRNQQLERDNATLNQRRDECRQHSEEELARLGSQQTEVKQRRDKSIAEIERNTTQLELNARQSLKDLYSRELEVKRRYNEALLAMQAQETPVPEGEHSLQS